MQNYFCDHFMLCKHHKLNFNVDTHKSHSILKYAHVDLWSSTKSPTLGDKKYFLSIVDDFFRKIFVFLLSQKSEAFSKFRKWNVLVKKKILQ